MLFLNGILWLTELLTDSSASLNIDIEIVLQFFSNPWNLTLSLWSTNSLDPDSARQIVVLDLDPNSFQRLLADKKSPELAGKGKKLKHYLTFQSSC